MIRRASILVGIVLSAVIHGLLLFTLFSVAGSAATRAPAPRPAPIQIASVDPQRLPIDLPPPPDQVVAPPAEALAPAAEPAKPAAVEPVKPADAEPVRPAAAEPKAVPPAASAPREVPSEPRPALPVTERVAAPARPARETRTDTSPAPQPAPPRAPPRAPAPADHPPGGDDDGVPPLRVHWNDASELIAVARALNMRLAAVNRRGDIVGEIDVTESPGLTSWRGLPAGYSNRVRMLSPSLFDSPLGPPGGPEIQEIWVFVPAARDRAMIEAQKVAARQAAVLPADVLYMDGRFVPSAGGSFELTITGVKRRGRGAAADG